MHGNDAMHDAKAHMMDLENLDPLTAQVFQAMRDTAHLHRQLMMKKLAQEGGHPGEVFCLRLLAHNDGISQSELADKLHLSRPWITKMLQAMEKSGEVVRRQDEQDQRVTRVFLTEAGRAREAQMRVVWAEYLNQTIGTLPEEDRRELLRLIRELSERVSRLIPEDGEGAE